MAETSVSEAREAGSRGRYELESHTSTNPVSTNQAPAPKGSACKVQFKCSEHEPIGGTLDSNDNIVPSFLSSK